MDLNNLYSAVKWINCLFDKKEQPKYLLDPITTIIKLAMLKYKPEYTKVRIIHQRLNFSDPGILQGINRWFMGDSRNTIQFLFLPILYFCCLKYRLTTNIQLPDELITILLELNNMAIDGLEKLRHTYINEQVAPDLVVQGIDLYVHLLLSNNVQFIKSKYDDVNSTTIKIYDEFTKMWTLDNLEIISKLFTEIQSDNTTQASINNTFDVMEAYLTSINHKIDKLRNP